MSELTQQEEAFIRDRKLLKNPRYVRCIKESDITLEGKVIESDKWQCKFEFLDKKKPAQYIRNIEGFFPAWVDIEIDDVLLNKDWFEFALDTKDRYTTHREEDFYCGLESGMFTDGKEVYHKGTGGNYYMDNYFVCKLLKRWIP